MSAVCCSLVPSCIGPAGVEEEPRDVSFLGRWLQREAAGDGGAVGRCCGSPPVSQHYSRLSLRPLTVASVTVCLQSCLLHPLPFCQLPSLSLHTVVSSLLCATLLSFHLVSLHLSSLLNSQLFLILPFLNIVFQIGRAHV